MISTMAEQHRFVEGAGDLGGTMRLGLYLARLTEGSVVAEAYGAWGEKKNYGRTFEGLIRSTIVVGPDGKVTHAQYNVKATGHVARLRRTLGLDEA